MDARSTGRAQREVVKSLFEQPGPSSSKTPVDRELNGGATLIRSKSNVSNTSNTMVRSSSNMSHTMVRSASNLSTASEMPNAMEGNKGVYRPISKLGSGQFGTCWEVEDELHNNQLWVVKQIFVGMLGPNETIDALKEAKLLATLKHPNVISLHEAFVHERQFVCIVTELCEGGDLSEYIQTAKAGDRYIPESQVSTWLIQLLLALEYLHDRKVLHRDVKTKNVFLKKGIVKLGDFGIARVLLSSVDNAQTLAGTPYYMSPESLSGHGYNAKSDMWALGCIVYELCLRRLAFDGDNLLGLTYKICEGETPELPDRYSAQLREIACSLLNRDPHERPSAQMLLQHPYIRRHSLELQSYLERSSSVQFDRERILGAVPEMTGKKQRKKNRKKSTASTGTVNSVIPDETLPWEAPGLTPKQRSEAKKLWEADQKADSLKKMIISGSTSRRNSTSMNRMRSQLGSNADLSGSNTSLSSHTNSEISEISGRSDLAKDPHGTRVSLDASQKEDPIWIREHQEIFPNGAPSLESTLASQHSTWRDDEAIATGDDSSNTSDQDLADLRSHITSTLKAGDGKTLQELARLAKSTQVEETVEDPPVNPDVRHQSFRDYAERKLGTTDFHKAYKFAFKMRQKGASDQEIINGFKKLMDGDPRKTRYCNDVDNLVMAEIMENKLAGRPVVRHSQYGSGEFGASRGRTSSNSSGFRKVSVGGKESAAAQRARLNSSSASFNFATASRTCTIL